MDKKGNDALTQFINSSRSGLYVNDQKTQSATNKYQNSEQSVQQNIKLDKDLSLNSELLNKEYHELNTSLSPKLSLINTILLGLISVILGVVLYYTIIGHERSFRTDMNTFRRYMFDNMLSTFKTSDKSSKFELHMKTVKKGSSK
jgi:hypothetical protein